MTQQKSIQNKVASMKAKNPSMPVYKPVKVATKVGGVLVQLPKYNKDDSYV